MRNAKKYCTLVSFSLLLALSVPMTCFARDKIETLSLSFCADLDSGTEWPSMEISGDEDGYSIDDFYFQTEGSEKYPQGVVTLLADDDHYFGTIKSADCEFEGEGARFVKAVKKSSCQLNVTVSFHEMGADMLENPSGLAWIQNNLGSCTLASWTPLPGAKHYEVRLMRDGKSVFTSSIETTGSSYDFSDMMQQPGSYYFRVRGVSRYHASTVSEWVDSPICQVGESGVVTAKLPLSSGSFQTTVNTPGRWISEQDAWYWENPDGSRASSQWIYSNGGWYYINANTRMASGWTWIAGSDGISRCYFLNPGPEGSFGKLYTDAVTPDGFTVNGDGAWTVNGIVQVP